MSQPPPTRPTKPSQTALYEGLLKKKSPKGFLAKMWQARYVILLPDSLLYFRKKGDVDPAGVIPMSTITSVKALADKKNGCRFDVVVGTDARTFCFLADTEAECDKWAALIEAQMKVAQADDSATTQDLTGKFWKTGHREVRTSQSWGNQRYAILDERTTASSIDAVREEEDLKSLSKPSARSSGSTLQFSHRLSQQTLDNIRVRNGEAPVEIIKQLTEGSFGRIYAVKDPDTLTTYLMHAYDKSQPLFLQFHRLFKDMGGLQHPYVLKQVHVGETVDAIFSVYTFGIDQSLFVHLRQHRRFPEHVARLFVAEVVSALIYLHKRGVIFSKLEPENIFLDEDGHACVSDFLLCLPSEHIPADMRTPEYATPEFLSGKPENEASDWWRLGILLYELAVGFPPFRSKTHNPQELAAQISSHKVGGLRFPSFLSLEAQDLICRLLQTDPSARVTSMQALQQHAFFKEIDWDALTLRQVESPDWVDEMLQNDRRGACARGLQLPEAMKGCHLVLNVIRARGLPALKSNGIASDPFCKVTCEGKVFKTPVVLDTIKPVWEEIFHLEPSVPNGNLLIEIYHEDSTAVPSKQSLIGKTSVALADIKAAKRLQGWYSIVGKDFIGHGEVYLSMGWVEYPLVHRILPNTMTEKTFSDLFSGSWNPATARKSETAVEVIPSAVIDVQPSSASAQEKKSIFGLASPRSAPSINNVLRNMVSKKKLRYQEDGFDLDLSYITERIIAMGFPSESVSGLYRNPMSEVQKFFDFYHPNHFRVFNLCSEDKYPPAKFQGCVSEYPFDDHNCPPFARIIDYCQEVNEILVASPLNVVATHCKAGKGRTGLMVCCALMNEGICPNATSAMNHFAIRRTSDRVGVAIPSQIRYVKYFHQYLTQYRAHGLHFPVAGVPLILTRVRMSTVPNFDVGGGCDPYFVIRRADGKVLYDYRKVVPQIRNFKRELFIELPDLNAPVQGDVKITFYDYDKIGSDDKMFALWLNSTFIQNNYLILCKDDLDGAYKDRVCKNFSADFKVEFFFQDAVGPLPLHVIDGVEESKEIEEDEDD